MVGSFTLLEPKHSVTYLVQNSFLCHFLGVCNCFWANECLEKILENAINITKSNYKSKNENGKFGSKIFAVMYIAHVDKTEPRYKIIVIQNIIERSNLQLL